MINLTIMMITIGIRTHNFSFAFWKLTAIRFVIINSSSNLFPF